MQTKSYKLVEPYTSDSFLISVSSKLGNYKICRIVVNKKNDIYLKYPYCLFEELTFCNGILIGNGTQNTEIKGDKLQVLTKVTNVKASHHNSGQIHFKVDGVEETFLIKQGLSLKSTLGHCFTTNVWGIEAFKQIEEVDIKRNPKRSKLLEFHFENLNVDSFKVVGKWFSIKDIKKGISSSVIGPIIQGKQEIIKKGIFCTCAQRYIIAAKQYSKYVLILEVVAFLNGRKNDENLLVHLTGFDDPSVINNLNVDSNLPFIHSTINKR